ncbi:glycosyltransferase family 2 protein [Dehalococcoidales bacterium]|nr:glycosyltransferase family 2 protein [Dehalococcoidales bacterium]
MEQPSHLSQETRLKVIAAIPCHNTETFIADVVSNAKKYVDQVIVIDDGSHDGTSVAARTAGALVINHGTNRGYGEAIKSCFEAAKTNAADVLVILDGDGQHDPDEIPGLAAPILNKEADLVIGSRFLQPTRPAQPAKPTQLTQRTQQTLMPRYRRFGINVITFLWNFGSKVKVSDAQSGFRAYSKKVFETFPLSEKGMSVSIETLEKARRKGAIIEEVPISCLYVPSTLNLKAIRHGFSVALAVIKIRLNSLWRRSV